MTNEHYLAFQQLDVYRAARELCERVHKAQIAHPVLRDQAGRASMSCFLQLSEGLPNDGAGLRNKYFVESNNSLHETVAAVDLAQAIGALSPESAAAIQQLGVRLKRMLRALRAPAG